MASAQTRFFPEWSKAPAWTGSSPTGRGRRASASRPCATPTSARSRCAGWWRRRTWPTSPCSFPPTWPATSPVKRSAWTAMSNIFDIVDGHVRLTSGRRKVIITCAVTGSVHTPSMSEYLPVTPLQIAEQAIEAARAGAAILHLHARNPDGSPTPDPAVFDEFVPVIAAETDAIINIPTCGGAQTTLEDRLAY